MSEQECEGPSVPHSPVGFANELGRAYAEGWLAGFHNGLAIIPEEEDE